MSKDEIKLMDSGELEMRKVFEETTTQNVRTILDYSKATRIFLREVELKVTKLQNNLVMKEKENALLKQQVSLIQAELYKRGT